MSKKSPFKINIIGLTLGEHQFDYHLDDTFFEPYPLHEDIKGVNCTIDLVLKKSSYQIVATLNIKGTLRLECDRSLEEFDYEINEQPEIFFKYGEKDEEIDDTLYHITSTLESLEFEDIFYQSIAVLIPMKKIHPQYIEEDDFDEDVEEVLIYSSQDDDETEENNDICDSRWEALKKLNIDNNKNKG